MIAFPKKRSKFDGKLKIKEFSIREEYIIKVVTKVV